MTSRRDPVERAANGDRDLYEISTWEERTSLDKLATGIYSFLGWAGRGLVVLAAVALLIGQFAAGGLTQVALNPEIIALTVLSAIPALGLAWYVWRTDATTNEPLGMLGVTFLLGVLFAMFAAFVNTVVAVWFPVAELGLLGAPLFFFVVVGPVEEAVKLLAVRLYAYRKPPFDSVVDGAVYGAVAGLGFATIENLIYITSGIGNSGEVMLLGTAGSITAVRALAGPGHVIYSAIAGYYLGLAKFNRRNRGPIVVKGLLIAAAVHATYNSLVGVIPGLMDLLVFPAGQFVWFIAFVIVFDGVFALFLLRKLERYRAHLHEVRDDDYDEHELVPERTEFDRPVESDESTGDD